MALNNDKDFQRRLLETFRLEAQEHLQGLTSGLIELENTSEPDKTSALLETIFRLAHNLKGAARAVDATEIELICQTMEGVFARLKRQELTPVLELLDVLHQAINVLQQLLRAERPLPPETATTVGALLGQLNQWLTPAAQPKPPAPAPLRPGLQPPHGAPPPEPKPVIPETIRIAAAKLDKVLFQAEQMLSARLAAAQRVTELQKLHQDFTTAQKEWHKTGQTLRAARQDLGKIAEMPSGSLPALKQVLASLEGQRPVLDTLGKQLSLAVQNAEEDDRNLSTMIEALLEDSKEALMLPFWWLLDPLSKMARDLARAQGKEVELLVQGGDIEVDRRILEEMKDPFIHLVRNSVDHGLEPPAARQARQKSPRGVITIALAQRAVGQVEITISDDGVGLDAAQIKAAAAQAGLRSSPELEAMPEKELFSLIFESGLSTTPRAGEISGRGLGLAIVREKVEKLGGSISVQSRTHQGVAFRLTLPLTLARFRGVLVRLSARNFILPTIAIEAVRRVSAEEIRTVQNQETILFDGATLGLVRLAQVLELHPPEPAQLPQKHWPVLLLRTRAGRFAFLADEILTEQEVLMKTLGPPLARVRHIAGATVLGDGSIAPILNVPDLIRSALRERAAPRSAPTAVQKKTVAPKSVLVVEDSITARTLLKNILQGGGYRVETAIDGVDAWNQLKSKRFNLLVSDIDMPRLNGFELTRRVRGDPQTSELPVVLVTALGSPEDQTRGLEAGASAYLVKSSFDQSNLLETIAHLLS